MSKVRQAAAAVFFWTCVVWQTHADTPPAAAVVTAHPLATHAGFEILEAGGNAFDAAVAVSAALAVVEPTGSGLGGGGFWLLHRATDRYEVMIDGRERAPLAAERDMYVDEKGRLDTKGSVNGARAAAIPGTPAALTHLASYYGRLPLAHTLAPAIRLTREGFVVDERYRQLAEMRLAALRASPEAARTFLHKNDVPPVGFVLKQPELAAVLDAIATQGAAGFYQGAIARQLVAGVRAAGGIWSEQDLAGYEVFEREPIQVMYQGLRITSAAPPSAGGIALATALNILQDYRLPTLTPVDRKHLIIEAMRRAYRDRAVYLGDPDFVPVPTEKLTHPYYAMGLRSSIRLDRATSSAWLSGDAPDSQGTDTTHFSIIDTSGNRVAATLSINLPFGSGFVPPGTGVLLNNEMDDFAIQPGVPNTYGLVGAEANAIAPGKRPLSSMAPTFIEDERGVAVLGSPGGSRIISMILLAILDYADGGDASSLVGLKRYHHQYLPDVVEYEPHAFSEDELEFLRERGHRLQAVDRAYGNMQAVFWDKAANEVSAGVDPRGGGSAIVRRLPEGAAALASP